MYRNHCASDPYPFLQPRVLPSPLCLSVLLPRQHCEWALALTLGWCWHGLLPRLLFGSTFTCYFLLTHPFFKEPFCFFPVEMKCPHVSSHGTVYCFPLYNIMILYTEHLQPPVGNSLRRRDGVSCSPWDCHHLVPSRRSISMYETNV